MRADLTPHRVCQDEGTGLANFSAGGRSFRYGRYLTHSAGLPVEPRYRPAT